MASDHMQREEHDDVWHQRFQASRTPGAVHHHRGAVGTWRLTGRNLG